MLSDVTLSYGGQSITLPGLYLLIGVLVVLGLIGFVVAITSARRIERKTTEATDILVVQLERIGDALDRLVTQNGPSATAASSPARPANEPARAANRPLSEWIVPGRSVPPSTRPVPESSPNPLERAARKPLSLPEQHLSVVQAPAEAAAQPEPNVEKSAPKSNPKSGAKSDEDRPLESTLSEPARTILFSMLGR